MMDADDDDEVDDLHHDGDHDDDVRCRPVDIHWITQKGSSWRHAFQRESSLHQTITWCCDAFLLSYLY